MPLLNITNFQIMLQRPRRNRKSAVIRDMVQENHLSAAHLIFPLFIVEGQNQKNRSFIHAGYLPLLDRQPIA